MKNRVFTKLDNLPKFTAIFIKGGHVYVARADSECVEKLNFSSGLAEAVICAQGAAERVRVFNPILELFETKLITDNKALYIDSSGKFYLSFLRGGVIYSGFEGGGDMVKVGDFPRVLRMVCDDEHIHTIQRTVRNETLEHFNMLTGERESLGIFETVFDLQIGNSNSYMVVSHNNGFSFYKRKFMGDNFSRKYIDILPFIRPLLPSFVSGVKILTVSVVGSRFLITFQSPFCDDTMPPGCTSLEYVLFNVLDEMFEMSVAGYGVIPLTDRSLISEPVVFVDDEMNKFYVGIYDLSGERLEIYSVRVPEE